MKLFQTVQELYEQSRGISWAVRKLIPERSLGIVYGESSTWKTFIMLDYILHRTYGLPWCGLLTKQAPGVFVSAEGSGGVWKRIKAWHDYRQMDFLKCPLMVISRQIMLPNEIGQLADDFDEYRKLHGRAPGDAVIDTFSQTFAGQENAAESVADYLNVTRRRLVQAYGTTVSVMHHTGHAGDNPRGSYTFKANVDFRIKIDRGAGENVACLTVEKQKDDIELPPLSFSVKRLQVGAEPDGEAITSLVAEYITDPTKYESTIHNATGGYRKILLDIAERGLTLAAARKEFDDHHDGNEDARRKAFYRVKKDLLNFGLIEIVGGKLVRCKVGHESGTK